MDDPDGCITLAEYLERLRRDGDVSAQAVWERGPRDD